MFLLLKGKGERKTGRETSMYGCLSHAPYWGPGPQPRHVHSLGIELVTLWFAGLHLIHGDTPAGAVCKYFKAVLYGIFNSEKNFTV